MSTLHSVVILTIGLAHLLQEFQKRLAGSGIEFYAAHPGIAKTGIFDRMEASWDKPLSTLLVRLCGAESIESMDLLLDLSTLLARVCSLGSLGFDI